MSNPAVITLENASNRKGKFKRFVIEDNIGESIHLHVNDMRIDFTVKEFLEFSSMIRDSLGELNFLDGYSVSDFDEYFLKECAPFLPKLKKIKIEKIKLSELKCIIHSNFNKDLNLLHVTSISDTPAFKYLHKDEQEFIKYEQFNYFGVDNQKRLLDLKKSIEESGYPYDNKYIILFNNQNIIRDGQHRAVILADMHGLDYEIKIMRFYFNGNKHRINKNKNNLKSIIKEFVKKYI